MSTNGTSENVKESLISLAAQRVRHISESDVSPQLKEKVSLAILDYLGAVASGLQAPWAGQLIKYARSRQGAPEAHVWGLQENISAETAAFVNAALAHSAIRDDMHLKSNSHIGSIVISASLALAQRDGWSGEQLLKAVISGYEVASFLGVAVQQSQGYNRHARPSGIVGAFGVAGAAIGASNVDEDVAINAMAFAANMASGYNEWAWAGGLEIYTEMGTASQAGIVAFDLARAGLKCSETLLEGRAGLFAALGATDGEKLFREGVAADIGKGIMDIRFKPVPGCNYAQTPLAVALRISQKHKVSGRIESVSVGCTSGAKNYPGCDNPGPFTSVQQTKMSIQFGVCAVLLEGNVSEQVFAKYGSKEISSLASGCTVRQLQEFEQDFREGRQPAKIQVKLSDGSVVEEELTDVPWLDSGPVLARFKDEGKVILPSEESRKSVVGLVQSLGELKEYSELLALFKQAYALP